jgi:hypothetical protein
MSSPSRPGRSRKERRFRHEEIYRSDVGSTTEGEPAETAPPIMVSMSLRVAIPRRVGLHQSRFPFANRDHCERDRAV